MKKINRHHFIQRRVLNFYQNLDKDLIVLPFDIKKAIQTIKNVKLLTYKEFSDLNKVSINEVVNYAESEDGSTHFDKKFNRYIILYNDEVINGRQRFTMAHELGHINLRHFKMMTQQKASYHSIGMSDKIIEREADWFASMVLCPFPVLRKIGVQTPKEIQEVCDISTQASIIKHEQYSEWCEFHIKSSWENDIIKLFSNYMQNY